MTATLTPPRTAAAARTTESRADFFVVVAAPVCAAIVLVGVGPFPVRLVAGVMIALVLPVMLVQAKVNWPATTRAHESALYSLALVVLAMMVGGLAINYLLPLAGVARPLDRLPVVSTLLVALVALGLWRPTRWRLRGHARVPAVLAGRDQTLLVSGVLLVVGAVAGAIRLNNGAGGAVTTTMLVFGAVVIVLLFAWRSTLRESTIVSTIYMLALSLLLMTSLRGWFVTGHDIQREFRLFELTAGQGFWTVDAFKSAYNACLSVTILPTIIQRATGIPDLYVFKIVFQSLYALCPVLIYLIARRFASRAVAVLAAVYFVAYPTYFGDMPFLNRQEVAFFFLGTAVLLMTDRAAPVRSRRIGFVVFGIGVVLSHYSTTYVLLAVLGFCWAFTRFAPVVGHLIRTRHGRHRVSRRRQALQGPAPPVITWAVLAVLAVLTFLWAGPITGAGGQVEQTFRSTLNSLTGAGDEGQRSSDASYAIIGGAKQSPEKRLRDFKDQAIESTASDRVSGANYSLTELDRYPTPVVPPDQLPQTQLGEMANQAGLSPSTLNGTLRRLAPVWLQACIAVGFLAVLRRRADGLRPSLEFLCGAVACVAAIALQVVLPELSVDYGILRAFGQGLFWLAPFLAVGSIQAFRWLGPRATTAALGVAVAFYLSLTGVIPQLFGGYPPQLHLNNAGEYYDNCYLHEQEATATTWLQARIGNEKAPDVQAHLYCYVYAFTPRQQYAEPSDGDDIFPVFVRKDAYAFLGYTTVQKQDVALSYGGDTVTYKYPVEFLDANKSLLYSSNGARIYR